MYAIQKVRKVLPNEVFTTRPGAATHLRRRRPGHFTIIRWQIFTPRMFDHLQQVRGIDVTPHLELELLQIIKAQNWVVERKWQQIQELPLKQLLALGYVCFKAPFEDDPPSAAARFKQALRLQGVSTQESYCDRRKTGWRIKGYAPNPYSDNELYERMTTAALIAGVEVTCCDLRKGATHTCYLVHFHDKERFPTPQ